MTTTEESCSDASGITDAAEIIVQLCKDINLSDETADEQCVRSSTARDLVNMGYTTDERESTIANK